MLRPRADARGSTDAAGPTYWDYVTWQEDRVAGPAVAAQRQWWAQALSGAPQVLRLPDGGARPAVRTSRGVEVVHRLDASDVVLCSALARAEGATAFMGRLAAVVGALARLTGQEDQVIGVPVAGRVHPALDREVGLFVNTLPVRITADTRSSFRELLRRTRDAVVAAMDHQEVPLDQIVDEVAPARASHRLVRGDRGRAGNAASAAGRITLVPRPVPSGTAKFDLAWSFRDDADTVELRLSTAADILPGPAARCIADAFTFVRSPCPGPAPELLRRAARAREWCR